MDTKRRDEGRKEKDRGKIKQKGEERGGRCLHKWSHSDVGLSERLRWEEG